jgi:small basic protein (TIGR04137 family)
MSLDRSLRTSGGQAKTRSVFTRAERVDKMASDKKLDKAKSGALGLPKTRVPKK